MPLIFKVGSYWVYFWSDENTPLEPIHVHVSQGKPSANATKIWITSKGKCLVANNRSRIPDNVLRSIIRIIEARSDEIIEKWSDIFEELEYYI